MTEQQTSDLHTAESEGQDDTSATSSDQAPTLADTAGPAETAGAVTPGAPDGGTPGGSGEASEALGSGDAVSSDAGDGATEGLTAGTADAERAAGVDGSADEAASDEGSASDSDEDAEAGDETGGSTRTGGRRSQLVREGEVAADFLETLLDICDLDGDLDVDIDGDRAAVAIVDSDEGRVPRRLVGQDGTVLEALQELTRLAVQSETGERSRLMLDVAGHRAERRATLVTMAKEAIEDVKRSGESSSLSPMSAFERKVVHDEVLAAGLHSESEGSEPRRYVVITPAT